MTRLRSLLLAGGLALLAVCSTSPLYAQDWQQELQVITPIPYESPSQVFLDSLVSVLNRNPDTPVRRSPKDPAPMAYDSLRNALYDDGIDLRGASHMFVRYRFDLSGRGTGIVETVQDVFFILRLDEAREDLPLLFVSTRNPLVSDLLLHNGIPSPLNMKTFTSFRKHVAFPVLYDRQETAIVEMGRQAVRDDLPPNRQRLITLLNEQMGFGPGSYALTTSRERLQERRDAPVRVAADTTAGP
jgi:hypothetical protein